MSCCLVMAWKWVETRILGHEVPREMRCLSEATSKDSPSTWRSDVTHMHSHVLTHALTCTHMYSHALTCTHMNSQVLTVAVPLPNSSRRMSDLGPLWFNALETCTCSCVRGHARPQGRGHAPPPGGGTYLVEIQHEGGECHRHCLPALYPGVDGLH